MEDFSVDYNLFVEWGGKHTMVKFYHRAKSVIVRFLAWQFFPLNISNANSSNLSWTSSQTSKPSPKEPVLYLPWSFTDSNRPRWSVFRQLDTANIAWKISMEVVALPALIRKTREIKEPRCCTGLFVTWGFPLKAKTSDVTNKLRTDLSRRHETPYRLNTTFFNPLSPELKPMSYLLALLAHDFLHVSRIRVKSLTLRLLMSYKYGAPILDVSRSHTTTQHSR
jgi:hypothetical protein